MLLIRKNSCGGIRSKDDGNFPINWNVESTSTFVFIFHQTCFAGDITAVTLDICEGHLCGRCGIPPPYWWTVQVYGVGDFQPSWVDLNWLRDHCHLGKAGDLLLLDWLSLAVLSVLQSGCLYKHIPPSQFGAYLFFKVREPCWEKNIRSTQSSEYHPKL